MKKILKVLVCMLLSASILTACGSEVDEPCMYCNQSPSKEYKMSSGEKAYVCTSCSSRCMLCNKKATKHYESLLGIVFVCDDCYKEATK